MKYFTIAEMVHSDTADRLGIPNRLPKELVFNVQALVDNVLDPLREWYGKPIPVSSGYRCPALNKAVGGVGNSYHLKGMAADLDVGSTEENAKLLRPKAVKKVEEAKAEGGTVVVVSASVNNWVEPFFSGMGGVFVVGTMVGVRDGVLTGRFVTKNCYGEEKVNRLLQLYPERKQYYLVAYGDSRGDFELLDFADESHYRPFR